MEQKIGKLKGTAYTREMYLFRKNYPIRWWLRRLFKKLIKEVLIKYRKPNGTEGEWAAKTSSRFVYYDFKPNDLDMKGKWTFWVWVKYKDNRVSISTPCHLRVYSEGS